MTLTPVDAEILFRLNERPGKGMTSPRLAYFAIASRTTVDRRLAFMKEQGLVEDDGKYRGRLYYKTERGTKAREAWGRAHRGADL